MKIIVACVMLLSQIAYATPTAKVNPAGDGKMSIDFFNDSGQPLRFSILAEGWNQVAGEGADWSYETSRLLGNGYCTAPTKGRTEKIATQTVSDVRRELPNRRYQKIKLRIILEWDEGEPNTWTLPQSRVLHVDVTGLVEPSVGGDAVNLAPQR